MPTLVELLEAGVQFGHKKHRSHPKAKEYIFTLREGVYVIDLEKTVEYLHRALDYFEKEIGLGKVVLFVGTKRQTKSVIKDIAESLNMPYVNHRWMGGTLTNFETINRNLSKLSKLEEQIKSPEFENFTKKERKMINDKRAKLDLMFGGLRGLKKLPDMLFVIDAKNEENAIKEAGMTGVPMIAICDTDANPSEITFPVPANDEAPRSINLIMSLFKETGLKAVGAGKKMEEVSLPVEAVEISVAKDEEKISVVEKEKPAETPKAKKEAVKKSVKKTTKTKKEGK